MTEAQDRFRQTTPPSTVVSGWLEVHRRGDYSLMHGSAAIVERHGSLRRWERYLTHRSDGVEVFRLRHSYRYV